MTVLRPDPPGPPFSSPPRPNPPRLLDRVRDAIRLRHYSPRTEEAYVGWTRRFILFHGVRHPAEMGAAEINRFLTDLAVKIPVESGLFQLINLYRSVHCFVQRWDEREVSRNQQEIHTRHRGTGNIIGSPTREG